MRVDVSLTDDRLEVKVRTETPEAMRLLIDRAAELKAALAAHGVFVERFDVSFEDAGGARLDPDGRPFSDSGFGFEEHDDDRDSASPYDEALEWTPPDKWGFGDRTVESRRPLLDVRA